MQGGEHQPGQFGWTGDNGDPDNFFFLLGCAATRAGANNAKWCNKDFDDLLKRRARCPSTARTKMYEEMQVITNEEAPWSSSSPIRSSTRPFKNVKG